MTKLWQLWLIFSRLGLTSFGGPSAHIGFFRDEFVTRRGWLSDDEFAQDNALCQIMPGPSSSQLGMLIGARHSGISGSIVAWLAFTTPSALLMLLAINGSTWLADYPTIIQGLLIGAASVVAHAIWGMAKSFCVDQPRQLLAFATAIILLLFPLAWLQLVVLLTAGVIGVFALTTTPTSPTRQHAVISRSGGILLLAAFALLLAISLVVRTPLSWLYQTGALVFGGGHVVLPMLQQRFVSEQLLTNDQLISGYAIAQILPGPLFAFSAFVAGVSYAGSWWWGVVGLVAIFVPGWLLIIGIQPWWHQVTQHASIYRALLGIQAAVVGLLGATLWDPLMRHALLTPADVALWVAGFAALQALKLPAWHVALACAVIGAV
ncbi:MAG: chromate efflux transporter, partial [Chloroflexi bacterium]|nr:chromate efflux transporter [Chloroflexota bacterium]